MPRPIFLPAISFLAAGEQLEGIDGAMFKEARRHTQDVAEHGYVVLGGFAGPSIRAHSGILCVQIISVLAYFVVVVAVVGSTPPLALPIGVTMYPVIDDVLDGRYA